MKIPFSFLLPSKSVCIYGGDGKWGDWKSVRFFYWQMARFSQFITHHRSPTSWSLFRGSEIRETLLDSPIITVQQMRAPCNVYRMGGWGKESMAVFILNCNYATTPLACSESAPRPFWFRCRLNESHFQFDCHRWLSAEVCTFSSREFWLIPELPSKSTGNSNPRRMGAGLLFMASAPCTLDQERC